MEDGHTTATDDVDDDVWIVVDGGRDGQRFFVGKKGVFFNHALVDFLGGASVDHFWGQVEFFSFTVKKNFDVSNCFCLLIFWGLMSNGC